MKYKTNKNNGGLLKQKREKISLSSSPFTLPGMFSRLKPLRRFLSSIFKYLFSGQLSTAIVI